MFYFWSHTHTDVETMDGLSFAEELLLRKREERGRTALCVKGGKNKKQRSLLFFLPSSPCWSIKFTARRDSGRRYQDAGRFQQNHRSQ